MELMTKEDWENVKHFSPAENWGDPYRIEKDLVFLLDNLRDIFDHPFVIHCGFDTSGHSANSQHYVGRAVDFHIEEIDFKDAVGLMNAFIGPPPGGLGVAGKIGLGIYPHWNNPGFHLDTRGERARWGAVSRNGKQVYVSFKEAYGAIK